MDKRPDFGKDLAALTSNVTAEVGDVLQALRQKQVAKRPADNNKGENMTPEQEPVAVDDRPTKPANTTATDISRRSRPASRSRLKPIIERDDALENVTTRLRRETNELLTEAALRQRLKKEIPATRQDIVEAALTDWFRRQGYALRTDAVGD
jgi:hypothetical protein